MWPSPPLTLLMILQAYWEYGQISPGQKKSATTQIGLNCIINVLLTVGIYICAPGTKPIFIWAKTQKDAKYLGFERIREGGLH